MRIAIVGSRSYSRLDLVKKLVDRLPANSTIVSGGAKGVDRAAENAALNRGLGVSIIYPKWDEYGKQAGILRNTEIVDSADAVVAFWDCKSQGTKDAIAKAKRAGKLKGVYDEVGERIE